MTIKEMRTAIGLSQAQFAERFHIQLGTLRAWEQGVHETPRHVLYMVRCSLTLEGLLPDNSGDKVL